MLVCVFRTTQARHTLKTSPSASQSAGVKRGTQSAHNGYFPATHLIRVSPLFGFSWELLTAESLPEDDVHDPGAHHEWEWRWPDDLTMEAEDGVQPSKLSECREEAQSPRAPAALGPGK